MTHVSWDYSALAESYTARPSYAVGAIEEIVATAGVDPGDRCCDVGAGTGHLTTALLDHGLHIDAVEPNLAMRTIGMAITEGRPVTWLDAVAEATRLTSGAYALITFGSSFNVVCRSRALQEAARLLRSGGWFACLWNHRELNDPMQLEIQEAIMRAVPDFAHGTRRENQSEVIARSGLFEEITPFAHRVVHTVDARGWAEGWRSHATLAQQAGERFDAVVNEIRRIATAADEMVRIPYVTRGWLARLVDA